MYSERTLTRVMKKIAQGKITRRHAAMWLQVSERHVNRLMQSHSVRRPDGLYKGIREAAAERRELRDAAATLALTGKLSVKQAAMRCGVSERTIYRRMEKFSGT